MRPQDRLDIDMLEKVQNKRESEFESRAKPYAAKKVTNDV